MTLVLQIALGILLAPVLLVVGVLLFMFWVSVLFG